MRLCFREVSLPTEIPGHCRFPPEFHPCGKLVGFCAEDVDKLRVFEKFCEKNSVSSPFFLNIVSINDVTLCNIIK
ncbi:MAG TPA: hypothetical protein DEO40_04785 [Treponema sp.]|jgi:hypothetical protein|nr:hypothetical protein [Treponema sp.]